MNVNHQIAEHLQQICDLFLKSDDLWRARAFDKVASKLRVYEDQLTIQDGKIVQKIVGVGEAINDVIVEFLSSGTSQKFENLNKNLALPVVERHDATVCKNKVSSLLKPLTDAGVDWGFAGSARRGLATVKDVDVIVCLIDEVNERALVKKILSDAGLEANVRDGNEKVGVSIPLDGGKSFTLDLNFTIPESRGAHYAYFTGPRAFSINQRVLAKKHGLRLNQRGLFRGKELIAGRTEEEIFQALGQPYLPPEKRA